MEISANESVIFYRANRADPLAQISRMQERFKKTENNPIQSWSPLEKARVLLSDTLEPNKVKFKTADEVTNLISTGF